MKRLSFYVDKKIHYVDIERTKNKNMYLKVKNGEIVVSASKLTSERTIHKFVSLHIKKFVEYVEKQKEFELFSVSEKFVYILGAKKTFTVLTGFKENILVDKNGKIYIETNTGEEAEVVESIKNFLKQNLLKYLEDNQKVFEEKMDIPHHEFSVVYKTSNWGTNMIGKKRISYSSKLSHFSKEVIDYVIVHELAHFKQPNHSSNFWDVVEEELPNYKIIKKQLRSDVGLEE